MPFDGNPSRWRSFRPGPPSKCPEPGTPEVNIKISGWTDRDQSPLPHTLVHMPLPRAALPPWQSLPLPTSPSHPPIPLLLLYRSRSTAAVMTSGRDESDPGDQNIAPSVSHHAENLHLRNRQRIKPLLRLLLPDGGPDEEAVLVEVDLDELPESGRVVVPHRAGVTKRLQDGVALQHLEHLVVVVVVVSMCV